MINNLLADLLIHQTFFYQMLEKSQFAKLSPHQTFMLYGNRINQISGVQDTVLLLFIRGRKHSWITSQPQKFFGKFLNVNTMKVCKSW